MKIPKTIFQVWTGDNAINENRLHGITTTRANVQANVQLLTSTDIKTLNKIHEFHPAYKFLSYVHRADYLRVWLMNFIGGGYTDIKPITSDNNWGECLDLIINNPEINIIGMKEIPGGSIRSLRGETHKLLSCGWFICRPHSDFTEEWFSRTTKYLDAMYDALASHPATNPREGGPGYPIPWTGILGNIFQPLCAQTYDANTPSISNVLRPGVLFGAPYR